MHSTQKLTQEEWLEIEVDLTDFEQRICSLMLQSGSIFDNNRETDRLSLDVVGDGLYCEMFQNTVRKLFFPEEEGEEEPKKGKKNNEKKEKKGGGKPGSKNAKKGKNDIYEKYMKSEKKKKLEEQFHDTLKSHADSLFRQKNFGFSSPILEFKLISFLVLAKLVKDKEEWVYEIIIGLKKCLQAYEGYKGKLHFSENEKEQGREEQVSPTLISEIKSYMSNLSELNVFSMKITFVRYPKLIYHTVFDSYFASIQLKPYDSQKDLLRGLKNYYLDRTNTPETNKAVLVFYKAMIGSGKTTVSLALAAMAKNLRAERPKEFHNLQVIFCCGLTQIRVQVGQLAYNSLQFEKLTFAVVSSYEGNIILRNHFSCRDAKDPYLIISDLESTFLLLQQNPDRNYILFLDEPIIDADQKTSPITDVFIRIMKYAPKVTILSSATLPNPEQMPGLVGMFRKRFENAEVFTIFSEQAKVAQQIFVNFNEKYYPHSGCKTVEDLAKMLATVRNNPFLARLYTGPSLYYFEDKLKKMGVPKLMSKGVENKFNDPRNMNQKYVQEYAFEILEALLENGDDNVIEGFCKEELELENDVLKKKKIPEEDKNEEEDDDEPRLIEKKIEENSGYLEEKIEEMMIENNKEEAMEEIIPKNKRELKAMESSGRSDKIKGFKWEELATKKAYMFTGGCLIATPNPIEFARKAFGHFVAKISMKNLLKDFEKQREVYEAELRKFEEIKNDEERLKKRSQYENENMPKILFPEYMKINLKAHLMKYSNLEKPELVGYRKDFLLEKLVLNIEEDLNLMLFSGVGVFESDRIFNEEYNKTIRNKAKFGELAYLISNKDILYGANYPLNNVIIDDSFANVYSINTIFQTMGRAGRIGQAWKSNCYIGQKIKKKLNEFIRESHKPDFISIEAQNIEKKIVKSFYEVNFGGDIVAKIRKIGIFFDGSSLDGLFSLLSATFFYMHKLEKSFRQHLSDVDFFQIVRLIPLDNLETIDSIENITTAYFLGVFPLKPSGNLNKVLGNCQKIIYIDHREFNKVKYVEFRKEHDLQAQKTKFIEIFEAGSTASVSLRYFKQKAQKKKLILDFFQPNFPNYVKKSHSQTLSSQVFEAFVKVVAEPEVSYELKAREQVSCLIEKAFDYFSSCGTSLKAIWKLATLKIEQIKGKATEKHAKVLRKCEALIEEVARVVILPGKGEECIGLYKVPISYYKYRNLIKELAFNKAISLKMRKVCVISWISHNNKEDVLVGVHSDDVKVNCEDLAQMFAGKGSKRDAEFNIKRKEFEIWKFRQVGK